MEDNSLLPAFSQGEMKEGMGFSLLWIAALYLSPHYQ